MAAANRKKVVPSRLVDLSSPSLKENLENNSNHSKRNRACAFKTSSVCLWSVFGGVAVGVLFVVSIVVPLVITLKTVGSSTTSTIGTTVTTTTPITETTTTITTVSTTSATTATTTSDTSTTSVTSFITSATSTNASTISTSIVPSTTTTTIKTTSTTTTKTTSTTSSVASTVTTATVTSTTAAATTITTDTTTTVSAGTTMASCTTAPVANLYSKTAGGVISWTQFVFNYTAASMMPTLIFGFSQSSLGYNYLDDVSVVDSNAPSVQLLINPSFENSTTLLNGWTTWCTNASICNTGFPGQILANSSCHSGNCFVDHCHNNYDYVAQSFSTTIGDIYTISFWVQQTGGGTVKFYASIVN